MTTPASTSPFGTNAPAFGATTTTPGTAGRTSFMTPTSTTSPRPTFTSSFGTRASAITEDTALGSIKIEDAGEGQRQIVFIHRVQQEYEARCARPIEGQEAFDLRLVQLDREMQRAIDQILPSLATEHDRSICELSEFGDRLIGAKTDFKAANLPARSEVCPFLQRFAEQLQQRSSVLKASLDAIDPPEKVDERRQAITPDVSALIRAITRQSNAIMCVSARIAQLEGRSQAVGDKLKNLNRGQPFSDIVMGAENWELRVAKMYKQCKEERTRRLNKRDKDAAKYKDPQQTGMGGGFRSQTDAGRSGFGTTSGFQSNPWKKP